MSEKNEINPENKTPKSKTPAIDRVAHIFNSPENIKDLRREVETLKEEVKTLSGEMETLKITVEEFYTELKDRLSALEESK